jgi:enterochelin esterase-like enzyme
MIARRATAPTRMALVGLGVAVFAAVGLLGVYRYTNNFWQYRGFPPPKDAPYVRTKGLSERLYVVSPALDGRRQPVDVYLPPGYFTHPARRYPVLYLLHGVPGRPAAFLQTVRMGVVEDELVAKRKAQPLILVMPFGSTGSFTDEEWANGVRPGNGWETFVARDLVETIDARYRTIRSPAGRAIGGLSEGGYGAINIGLHHPREFKVIESWSGYAEAADISSIFGHERSLLIANTPLDTLSRAAPILRERHVYIWFYSGTDDKFRFQNEAFARALTHAGVAHRFFLVRGGHNWALWRGNAARSYLVASEHLA